MFYPPARSVTKNFARGPHTEFGKLSMRDWAGATSGTTQTDP